MTFSLKPPNPRRELDALDKRIYELERRIRLKSTDLNFKKPEVTPDLHPAGIAWRTTNQAIFNGSETYVTFEESYVQGGMTWDGSNGLTVPRTGWYLLTAVIKWETNATGQRSLHIGSAVGGPGTIADVHVMAGSGMSGPGMNASVIHRLNAGDTMLMMVLQNSGPGDLDLLALPAYTPYFAIHWMGAT